MTPYIFVGLEQNVQRCVILKVPIGMTKTEKIIAVCSQVYGITPEQTKSKSQKKECFYARCSAMYLIRSITGITLKSIGRIFNRDHSTVIYNLEIFHILLAQDATFRKLFGKIREIN